MLCYLKLTISLKLLANSLSSVFIAAKASEPHADKCVEKVKSHLSKITHQKQFIQAGIALDILTSQPINHDILHSLNLSILAEQSRFALIKNPLAACIGDYLKSVSDEANKVTLKSKIAI
ncbi:MAG: hypothetical protein ABI597_04230 [Gammaproteobacteria bacterium]